MALPTSFGASSRPLPKEGRTRPAAGSVVGGAGEWIAYLAASWMAYSNGGVAAAALLLVCACSSHVLVGSLTTGRSSRSAALLSPIGLVLLWNSGNGSEPLSPAVVAVAGIAIGAGAAWAGRASAWAVGIAGPPAPSGLVAMAVAIPVISVLGAEPLLMAAAIMLAGSALLGESRQHLGATPAPLIPAAVGAAAVVGLRAAEAEIVVASVGGVTSSDPVSTALFALAWTAGLRMGWSGGSRMDARLVLGAPFAAAACGASLGEVEGAGALFLYAALGGLTGVIFGAASMGTSGSRREVLLIPVLASAVWVAFAVEADFSMATGAVSVVLLAGGFASLAIARRIPEIEPPETKIAAEILKSDRTPKVRLPVVMEPEPSSAIKATLEDRRVPEDKVGKRQTVDGVLGAMAELRGALAYARQLRKEALESLRHSYESPSSTARRNVRGVLEDLEAALDGARRALQARNLTSAMPTE